LLEIILFLTKKKGYKYMPNRNGRGPVGGGRGTGRGAGGCAK